MNSIESGNSLNNSTHEINQINFKNSLLSNLQLSHKFLNSLNISLLILIFILSFLSFSSQREWTTIYKNLVKTRANNNNLIDYISKTEELYINQFESLNTFKKTTPKDLIYLDKKIIKQKKNKLIQNIESILDGLKDSKYQKGY